MAINLSDSGKPGRDRVPAVESGYFHPEFLHEFRPLRSWSDKTHVTAEDIPELREFIHGRGAQDSTHARNPGISFFRGNGSPLGIRVRHHGAELYALEILAVLPHARLGIENGASILDLDGHGNRGPKRRGNNQTEPRDRNVKKAFEHG